MFRLFRFDLLIFGSVSVHTNLIWRRGVITRGGEGRSLSYLLMGLQRQKEPIYIQRWGPSGRVQVQSSVLAIQRQPLASSDAAAWSEPVCTQQRYLVKSWMGNALYFGNLIRGTALKYNWELRRTSLIRLPSLLPDSLLTTTEDGGLGLVTRHVSKLYVWSWKDTHEVDNNAIWERRVIELNTVFPVNVIVKTLYLVGSADGIGIIFMRTGDEVYAVDLKTCKAKKVFEGRSTHSVVAYMSFCTQGTCCLFLAFTMFRTRSNLVAEMAIGFCITYFWNCNITTLYYRIGLILPKSFVVGNL